MRQWLWTLSAALFLITNRPLEAAGFIVVPDGEGTVDSLPNPGPFPPRPGPRPRPIPPPYIPPVERRFRFAPLEVTSVQVKTEITDQFAKTTLEEEFYNPNPRPIEGTFLFPLPKGAQVEKFAMEIGGKSVEAELLDAEKARRLYEEIVRQVKDPALLEYAGRDLLKARIFPIEANGRKRITVRYSELLKSDSGLVSYAFPMGAGKYSARPVRSLSMKIEIASKRPLKSIYSPSHNVEVVRLGPERASVGFEASNLRPEGDFQVLFSAEKDELGFNFIAHRTGPDDGYFLLLASPGFEARNRKILAKDVAFVLDTSGSMAGAKLEQAKKALLFCVENLNANDRFEIIRFATETEPLFNQLTENTSDNRTRATDFIKALKPIGGTAIDDALRKALSLHPNEGDRPFIVVFLTDGLPTVGTTDQEQILAHVGEKQAPKPTGSTRVFCFGIGTDVNTHLLDRIAEQTRAISQYVLPEEDLEVKVSSFFSKIKEPILANLRLVSDGAARITKLYPANLPDLFQGDQLVVAGRYAGSGDGQFTLEGVADGETKRFTYKTTFPEKATENAFIPRLWAARRVGFLLDEIRLRGENQELRQEVTELARQFGIVTPYTAYLILEDENQRRVPVALQSLPRLNEDRAAQEIARRYYSSANRDKSGEAAVAGARYGLALKQTDNFQALSMGAQEADRGLAATASRAASGRARPTEAAGVASPNDSVQRLVQYSQQAQYVNGRNFFLNGSQWVDSRVQAQPNAKHVRIQFNSADYFTWLKNNPETAPWLALGRNVQFLMHDTIYAIVD